jgi:predicted KAP-like P-loop ATPase
VVFVDDLDRCTPEKALEVLESIKAFFDIKGIVYVIGMDSASIDHIINQKYGKNSKIKGIDYLDKIVRLPF